MRTLLPPQSLKPLIYEVSSAAGVAKIRLESDEMRTLLLQRDFLKPLILRGLVVKRVF